MSFKLLSVSTQQPSQSLICYGGWYVELVNKGHREISKKKSFFEGGLSK